MHNKKKEERLKQHALCMVCGLCCDGSIFSALKIKDREITPIFEGQLQGQPKDKKLSIKQPCTAWIDDCCSIYNIRPQSCRIYQCKLLKSCIRGKQSWTKAHSIITESRQHLKRIEAELLKVPDIDNTQYIHGRYNQFLALIDMKQIENKKKYARLSLEYYAFSALIDRYFHSQKKLQADPDKIT